MGVHYRTAGSLANACPSTTGAMSASVALVSCAGCKATPAYRTAAQAARHAETTRGELETGVEVGQSYRGAETGQVQIALIADPKPYSPNVRRSAEVFKLCGNPEIKGWQGRVRNRHHDHTIVDFGADGRCCEHADKLGRHMHMQPQAVVISAHRIGPAPVRREARIDDVITVDGADWRIVVPFSLDDPYLLPA